MAVSVDDKYPQWMRIRTNDFQTPQGRYVLSGGTAASWADYGRWVALRQMLAQSPGATLDVSDQRELRGLARELGFSTPRRCLDFLQVLASCDAIDPELLARGTVADADVLAAQQSYQSRLRANRSNARRGGRPRGRPAAATEPNRNPTETQSVSKSAREAEPNGNQIANRDETQSVWQIDARRTRNGKPR